MVTAPTPLHLPLIPSLAARLTGVPLMLLLDIDGTLAPIASRPDQAGVPGETRDLLDALSKQSNVFVVAVSGRAVDDARRMLGVDGAWVLGNHGAELGEPGQPATAREDVAQFADAVATAVRRSNEALSSYRGVIVEDKRWTLSIHYRLTPRDVVPSVIAKATAIANALGLRVTLGKEVIELRPPVDVHKGSASVELAERFGALRDGSAVLCAGDDRTDEDMFRSVRACDPRAVTVHVTGHRDDVETAAEFIVDDPTAVRELLRETLALHA